MGGPCAVLHRVLSRGLQELIQDMLLVDPRKRPSVNKLLSKPIIKARIQHLLSAAIVGEELTSAVRGFRPCLCLHVLTTAALC